MLMKEQPEMYCHEGEEGSNDLERDNDKRSVETGAEEYEYEL